MTIKALSSAFDRARHSGVAGRFALSLFIAALLIGGPALMPFSADGTVFAQDKKKKGKDKAPMEGRKTQALSKKVYEIITEANELVDAENYSAALKLLDKAKAMPKLSPYETAQLYSFYGFLYFNAERYNEAIKA